MATKRDIVEKLIHLLPDSVSTTMDQAQKTWFVNLRSGGGLRLTDQGYLIFEMLEIEKWSVPFELKNINKVGLLLLDRKLTFPYYINLKKKQLIMLLQTTV